MRKDKAERMESVLEGREDRSYGAAAGRRKKKTGERLKSTMAEDQSINKNGHVLSKVPDVHSLYAGRKACQLDLQLMRCIGCCIY